MGNECDYRWMLRGDSVDLLRDVVVRVWGFVCGGDGKLFFCLYLYALGTALGLESPPRKPSFPVIITTLHAKGMFVINQVFCILPRLSTVLSASKSVSLAAV